LIRDRELVSIFKFLGLFWCFLSRPRVEGCLSHLFLESDGMIAFDSRFGASFLTRVFGLVMVSSPVDQRSNCGEIQRSVGTSLYSGV